MAEKEIKHAGSDRVKRSYFDKSRREEYTILIPDMLPIHFKLIMAIYKKYGYNMELLQNCSRNVIDEGLKNTHNDACYPALLVIGQFMDALKSGKYDLEHTALLMSQTGGGCRASNYIHLIRKALSTQFPEVPVLSLNFSGLEKDASIDITPAIAMKLIYAVLYGDMLMLLYNQCKPYEIEKILRTSFWQGGSTGLESCLLPRADICTQRAFTMPCSKTLRHCRGQRRRSLR